MRQPKGCALHKAAPTNRRHTPIVSGDADFDHAIAKCKNRDVPSRLKEYVASGESYGYRTAYRSYTGPSYRGDD